MRKYVTSLLVLGVLAANSAGVSADGLLSSLRSGLPLSKASQQTQNQRKADAVKNVLQQARIDGYDLGIEVRGEAAILTGKVRDVQHRALAERVAKSVPGISTVQNDLTYVPQGGVQQVAARVDTGFTSAVFESSAADSAGIQQTHYRKPGKRAVEGRKPSFTASRARQTAARQSQQQPVQPQAQPVQPQTQPVQPQTQQSAEVQQVRATETARPLVAQAVKQPSNQEIAQNIGGALKQAGLTGYNMEIRFKDGVAMLGGEVSTVQQREAAAAAASRVPGVKSVDNRLTTAGPIAQAAFGPRTAAAPAVPVGLRTPGPVPAGVGAPGYPAPGYPAQGYPAPGHPAQGYPATPVGWGGAPAPIAPAGNYSNPNLPEHAWPAYAQYPNSAAIQYPKQYSASAWPYIGPFYPYPQVPLGWREVSLQWDDGFWRLDFEKKQDPWYWLFSPPNFK